MRILKDGDKSQAVCLQCKRLVGITYHYGTYTFPNRHGEAVDNVLQGFCDLCGSLAAIPAQSSPKIRKEIRKNDTSVEARVTPPLEDMLYVVSSRIRLDPQLTMRMLINFFAHEWMQKPKPNPIQRLIASPLGLKLLRGRSSCRVTSRVDAATLEALDRIQEQLQVTRTELFKAVLIEAGIDLVERPNSPAARRFFKAASLLGYLDEKPAAAVTR